MKVLSGHRFLRQPFFCKPAYLLPVAVLPSPPQKRKVNRLLQPNFTRISRHPLQTLRIMPSPATSHTVASKRSCILHKSAQSSYSQHRTWDMGNSAKVWRRNFPEWWSECPHRLPSWVAQRLAWPRRLVGFLFGRKRAIRLLRLVVVQSVIKRRSTE